MEYDNIELKEYQIDKMDVSEIGNYYVLTFSQRDHLKVSEKALKIFNCIDGESSIEEVCERLSFGGISITTDELQWFIKENIISNNLHKSGSDDGKQGKETKLWFHFPLINGEKLKIFSSKLTFLIKKRNAISVLVSALIMQVILLYSGHYSTINLFEINTLGLIIIGVFTFFFHELGHVTTAVYYDVSVGSLGIGMYLSNLVFYVDMSNTWKLDRKKRAVTDLGGIYFQIICILFFSIFNLFFNLEVLKYVMIFSITSIISNLNPMLRYDGYWAVTDLTGIINIDRRSREVIKKSLNNIFHLKKPSFFINVKLNNKQRRFLMFYIIAYTAATIVMVGGSVIIIYLLLTNLNYFRVMIFEPIAVAISSNNYSEAARKCNNALIYLMPILYFAMMIVGKIIDSINIKKKSNLNKESV